MLIYEYTLKVTTAQRAAINEAICVAQFVHNKCLRLWMDEQGVGANDLQTACSCLAHEFTFVARLNSQARKAAADRVWAAINRFYANCTAHWPGKKGSPRFQRDCRSVEDKGTGWKLDPDGKHLTVSTGCGIGRVKLLGSRGRELATCPVEQSKRVRRLHPADGHDAQVVLQAKRRVPHVPTGRVVGVDVGLHGSLLDADGQAIANPRVIPHVAQLVRRRSQQRRARKSPYHKQGKKAQYNHAARQRATHTKYSPVAWPVPAAPTSPSASSPASAAAALPPAAGIASATLRPPRPRQSAKRHTARQAVAKMYLKLQWQREDVACKHANTLVSSHNLIALEGLQIRNLVRNRHQAKAISDVGRARFRYWVEYYGRLQPVPVIAVPPQYTGQLCSGCRELVPRALSMRTPVCPQCGLVLDRDHHAALLIREAGLARGIQQGVWEATRHQVIWSGSGAVGHTGT